MRLLFCLILCGCSHVTAAPWILTTDGPSLVVVTDTPGKPFAYDSADDPKGTLWDGEDYNPCARITQADGVLTIDFKADPKPPPWVEMIHIRQDSTGLSVSRMFSGTSMEDFNIVVRCDSWGQFAVGEHRWLARYIVQRLDDKLGQRWVWCGVRWLELCRNPHFARPPSDIDEIIAGLDDDDWSVRDYWQGRLEATGADGVIAVRDLVGLTYEQAARVAWFVSGYPLLP